MQISLANILKHMFYYFLLIFFLLSELHNWEEDDS
jgi:hypothetical protein